MFKKTKIVCTLGPASWSEETLRELIKAGMNIARLNFSHGTLDEKEEQINLVRKLSKELDKNIGIIADIQGPKLRLGEIDGKVEIKKGSRVDLSLNPVDDELPVQFDLSPYVKKNQRIFLNDGLVELKVTGVSKSKITTLALNAGVVSSHKGINIPDTSLRGNILGEKDIEDIKFALEHNVDYLAISFIQSAADLKSVKDMIKKYNPSTKIISKIEKPRAFDDIENIVKASDAIMVARGDLAIETSSAEIPILQQILVRTCRQYQKPVIVATQMLESMTENPRPTRAEASDVGNAVLDQVDAVMLSAESASGKYPVETVTTMRQIIENVEQNPGYVNYIKINWENITEENLEFNAIVSSAASIAYRIGAKAIIVATGTGRTATLLSSFRPNAPIIAVTSNTEVHRQLALVWNVTSKVLNPTQNLNEFVKKVIEEVKDDQLVKKNDKIVLVTGSQIGTTGTTDTVKVITI